jgi:hypothetical protein
MACQEVIEASPEKMEPNSGEKEQWSSRRLLMKRPQFIP